MKVLVNTGFLSTANTKQCRYFFYQVFKQIVVQNTEHEFYFIVTKENESNFLLGANCFSIKFKSQQQTNLYKKFWINIKLPMLLKSIQPHVIIQPVEYFNHAINIPQILILCNESSVSKRINVSYQFMATTESLKEKIIKDYGLSKEKIDVVYAAPDKIFKPVNEIIKRKTKDEFSWGYEYFLLIDETGSEKSFVNVLKAFSIFKNKQKSNMKLLVLSDELLYDKNITEKLRTYKYRDDVILLEDLNEQSIAEVIASAYTVLYLSTDANSCLPIMWSMQSCVPIIASKNESVAEISDSFVLQAEVSNHENIAQQMLLLYKDESYRNSLIEKGFQQANKYSWDNSSERFWQTVLKAAGQKSR